MNSELVVDAKAAEVEIALLEDKKLVQLNKDKRNVPFSVGDIYLGKVKKIMPGLNAAFIDVGYEKDAFLHYLDLGHQFRTLDKFVRQAKGVKRMPLLQKFPADPDINKNGVITEVLRPGLEVLVQIAKEPISTKGPRLTSELSIAGRNLVLMPFSDKVSVSQKIQSSEEKKRLKQLLQSIKPKNFGVIIRTVAEGKRVAELDKELRNLTKKWEESVAILRKAKAPSLVIPEIGRTSAILRDILNSSFNNVYINDEDIYKEVRDYVNIIAPERQKIVKLYKGEQPIFDHYGVAKQVKALFGKTVSFKNGAYLIIEHTEALHVIDVNSGNRSKSSNNQETNAVEVNLAAAEEIARQLRLRDMGGIIVVDFIDMHEGENRQKVFEKMRQVMSTDRTKHNILPLSKFGLMQITRQRVRPELHINVNESCPTCHGKGNISPSILFTDTLEDKIEIVVNQLKIKEFTLKVHPFIAAYINQGFFSLKWRWRFQYSFSIKVMPVDSFALMDYRLENKEGKKINIKKK